MKILFIGPLPDPVTGHSLACRVLLEELVRSHSVEVVDLKKTSFREGFGDLKRIARVFTIVKEAWDKKKGAHAIYLTISESFGGNLKDLLIYMICWTRLSKMYVHLHGGSIKRLLWDRHRILFAVNRFFIKRLAGVIISGDSHLEIFREFVPRQKVHIVPNFALDHLFVTEQEISDKFSDVRPLRVVYISNFIEKKGYNELLDAYLTLDPAEKKRIRIDFAGRFDSESQKTAFQRKIDGIEQIRFHGIVNDSQKRTLFVQAHIFCLPTSFLEGQPISILEAYAAGCVVLTTGQSGIRDVFTDNLNGFEILERSPESIRSTLEKNLEQADSLKRIALHNRAVAEKKYRVSTYCAALKKIIESGAKP